MIIRRYVNSHSVTLTCGAIVQFTAIQAFFDPANRSAVARISKAACLAAGNTAIGLHNRMGGLSVRNDRANVKLKLPTAIPTDKQQINRHRHKKPLCLPEGCQNQLYHMVTGKPQYLRCLNTKRKQ